eukprot:107271-Prymnesium_polylepis.1
MSTRPGFKAAFAPKTSSESAPTTMPSKAAQRRARARRATTNTTAAAPAPGAPAVSVALHKRRRWCETDSEDDLPPVTVLQEIFKEFAAARRAPTVTAPSKPSTLQDIGNANARREPSKLDKPASNRTKEPLRAAAAAAPAPAAAAAAALTARPNRKKKPPLPSFLP